MTIFCPKTFKDVTFKIPIKNLSNDEKKNIMWSMIYCFIDNNMVYKNYIAYEYLLDTLNSYDEEPEEYIQFKPEYINNVSNKEKTAIIMFDSIFKFNVEYTTNDGDLFIVDNQICINISDDRYVLLFNNNRDSFVIKTDNL